MLQKLGTRTTGLSCFALFFLGCDLNMNLSDLISIIGSYIILSHALSPENFGIWIAWTTSEFSLSFITL